MNQVLHSLMGSKVLEYNSTLHSHLGPCIFHSYFFFNYFLIFRSETSSPNWLQVLKLKKKKSWDPANLQASILSWEEIWIWLPKNAFEPAVVQWNHTKYAPYCTLGHFGSAAANNVCGIWQLGQDSHSEMLMAAVRPGIAVPKKDQALKLPTFFIADKFGRITRVSVRFLNSHYP